MNNKLSFTELELRTSQREVETLHAFFASWYNGEEVKTEERFARFADVMDEQFHMIAPDGNFFDRKTVLEFVRTSCGQFGGENDPFTIEIRNFRVTRRISRETLLVMYEEWQSVPGLTDMDGQKQIRGRLSAAGLQADDEMVNGWRWLFVHEVWLPE